MTRRWDPDEIEGGMPAASAIVLAGGRSSRFGSDKLATMLAGRPLVEHAVHAVAAVSRDVLLIGARGGARGPGGTSGTVGPLPSIPGVSVRRAMDSQPFAGPLVALATALELVREPYAFVVGGDMPTLSPAVLRAMLVALHAADGMGAACLLWRSQRQPLPIVLRVGVATDAVRTSVASGERSLMSLFSGLRTRALDESEWRPLDPTAATLVDVDRPEDLPR